MTRGCRCAPQPHSRQLDVHAPACSKLHATDWLKTLQPPSIYPATDLVEVRFKNSRKEFFQSPSDLELETGDIVAVESSPGHDIGIVTLTGEIVRLQLKNKKSSLKSLDFKKVYRKAKVSDIEKWVHVVRQEDDTMFRARGMASDLRLNMKISDVEYQGDRTKATFYYTADDRVDFRELIRVLADAFHVRIEMRQIGMRQEASRLGGIGSCGRELCCATWLTNFRSVSTNAARTQQLSLNPQKLAGQCSKLKCCINYENDCYVDALKGLPDTSVALVAKKGTAFFQKHDVLGRQLGYSYKEAPGQVIMLPAERVREIIRMNRKKEFPEDLADREAIAPGPADSVAPAMENSFEDSLTRFDKPDKTRKRRRKRKK